MSSPENLPKVLIVSDDAETIDDCARLVAASQMDADVVADFGRDATAVWTSAAAVLIGADVVGAVARAQPPRRDRVFVLSGPDRSSDVWQFAVRVCAEDVFCLPDDEVEVMEAISRTNSGSLAAVCVALVGSRVGAGASCLAAAMAVVAARSQIVTYLLDLDATGCGQPVILGEDDFQGVSWQDVTAKAGRIPPRSLDSAVGEVQGVRVIAPGAEPGPIDAELAAAVIDAARYCAELIIVDIGRGFGPAQMAALGRSDHRLLVVPTDVCSVKAAQRLTTKQLMPDAKVVVRGPNPGGITVQDVQEVLGLPVIASMSSDRGLAKQLERADPPGSRRSPLRRASTDILMQLAA